MVGHVIEIEEVGVVEEGYRSGIGDDALLEIIAESATKVAAEHEVEIFAMEAEVGSGIRGGDFAVGADFEFEFVEYLVPCHLGVGMGGNEQHKCYCGDG